MSACYGGDGVKRILVMALAVGTICLTAGCAGADAKDGAVGSVAARRAELQKLAILGAEGAPAIALSLEDESPLIRRTAVRLLAQQGRAAEKELVAALGNSDALVRRMALHTLAEFQGAKALPHLAKGLNDSDAVVRQTAVLALVALQPRTEAVTKLLQKASLDKDSTVRKIGADAIWPFYKETILIRNRADYDHDVTVAQTIALPKDGWKFHLDSQRDGHLKKWFKPAFDDTRWDTISIEQAWQQAGYQHTGVAWYRRTLDLPAEPKHVAVEIRFDGVDESAWVWVNGRYAGQHDIGPEGWDKPFGLDITKEVKWGAKNQITVRAMNTQFAGGIWRPVRIEILQ